jgi:hypothetical protein
MARGSSADARDSPRECAPAAEFHAASDHGELERECDEIVVEHWTPRSFLDRLRACKLYDYTQRQWLDFDGNPTSQAYRPQ